MPEILSKLASDFETNLLVGDRYLMLLKGLGVTLVIAAGASVIGSLLGTLVALMRLSNKKIGKKTYPLRTIARVYVDIIRGTPVVVQLMMMYYVILTSPNISKEVVAIISFGVNSGAYVSEMVRSGIMSVEKGQAEAGRSLGLSAGQTMRRIILPQSVQIILPNLFNEFIMLLKETSVVGFIGLMDLTKAGDFIRSRTYSAFFPLLAVAIIYFLIVNVLTRLFTSVERRWRARTQDIQ